MQGTGRTVTAVVVCLVGLSAAVAGAVGAPAGSVGSTAAVTDGQQESGQGAPPGAAVQEAVDPDVVVMRAEAAGDGTATWSVAYRTRLDDENTTAAFESLQADIKENPATFTERFGTGMRRTVRSAENRTGREMELRNLTVEATTEQIGQEYGVVTYRFTWTAFAAVDGEGLRIGDALSGLFLDSETSLVVAYPEGYAVESVTPRPTENRTNEVVWRGQLDFGPDRPRLVVAPVGGGPDVTMLAGMGAVLLAILAGGYLVVSRVRDAGEAADETATSGEGSDTPAAGATDEPPEELLSNEERVLHLLEDNGGRIKQQRIAEEFDWTDAKTSQVVGNLREEDEVETFRIGRENVVTLPEESDL